MINAFLSITLLDALTINAYIRYCSMLVIHKLDNKTNKKWMPFIPTLRYPPQTLNKHTS